MTAKAAPWLDSLRLVKRRARKWARIAEEIGPKRALFAYVREGLSIDGLLDAATSERIDVALRDRASSHARVDEALDVVAAARVELSVLRAELAETRGALAEIRGALAHADARAHDATTRVERLEALLTSTLWYETATLEHTPLVSVVLPTRNRPEALLNAISSVRAQTYSNWELLIVDDARPGERTVANALMDDSRVRVLRGSARGLSSARNIGLDHVSGSLVTYLDDDNFMFPGWLKAVVAFFEARTEVEVAYGARVMQRPWERHPVVLEPAMQLERFDRSALERGNFIDAGVMAHRASIKRARFDESLPSVEDWDFMLQLTREKPAHRLPVFACAYRMPEHGRLSRDEPTMQAAAGRVLEKHARRASVNPPFET